MNMERFVVTLLLLALGAFGLPTTTQACTIDGQPTAYADGRRAVNVYRPATGPTPATWSPFAFTGRFRVGMAVRFTEDRAQLRRTLPRHTADHAWRWDFGDGTHATGWTPVHRYTRPGTYLVVMSAYYPAWRHYYPFDDVSMTVVR